jgi:hypothetical protein
LSIRRRERGTLVTLEVLVTPEALVAPAKLRSAGENRSWRVLLSFGMTISPNRFATSIPRNLQEANEPRVRT